jgi:hypothetical protein
VVTLPSYHSGKVATLPSYHGKVVTLPSYHGKVVTLPSYHGKVVTLPSYHGKVVTLPSYNNGKVAILPQTHQLAPCGSVSNFHLPSPFPTNHLSPFVANPTYPPTSSTKSPLTPQFSINSPLPIGPSHQNFPKNQPVKD